MSLHRLLLRIVIVDQKVTRVEATMGKRGWVGKGRRRAGEGGAVLVTGRAMRGVSMAMDMDMGKIEQKQREMHMRRCLGGKGPVLVVVAVMSIKPTRRHEQ